MFFTTFFFVLSSVLSEISVQVGKYHLIHTTDGLGNWHVSQEYCNYEKHSHLASIHSEYDYNYMRELMRTLHDTAGWLNRDYVCKSGVWIGLHTTSIPSSTDDDDIYSWFEWADGTEFNFSRFSGNNDDSTEPDDYKTSLSCVYMQHHGWVDVPCDGDLELNCALCNVKMDPALQDATTDEPLPDDVEDEEETEEPVNGSVEPDYTTEIVDTTEIDDENQSNNGEDDNDETDLDITSTLVALPHRRGNSSDNNSFSVLSIVLIIVITFIVFIFCCLAAGYFWLRKKKLKVGIVQIKDDSLDENAYRNDDIIQPNDDFDTDGGNLVVDIEEATNDTTVH